MYDLVYMCLRFCICLHIWRVLPCPRMRACAWLRSAVCRRAILLYPSFLLHHGCMYCPRKGQRIWDMHEATQDRVLSAGAPQRHPKGLPVQVLPAGCSKACLQRAAERPAWAILTDVSAADVSAISGSATVGSAMYGSTADVSAISGSAIWMWASTPLHTPP